MGKKKSNVSEISEASFDGGEPSPEVLALRAAIHSMKHEVMRYRREAHQAIVQADESRRSQVEMRMLLKDMANALDARTIQVATMESKCMHLETLVDGSAQPAQGGPKSSSKPGPSSGPAAVSTASASDGKKVKELEAALAVAEAKLNKLGDADAKLTASAKREAELEQRLAETEKALEAAEEAAADLEDKYLKGEALRRSLHNQIMDLKGAIRVFCRVRPALEGPQFAQLPTGEPVIQFSIDDERGIDLMERNQRYGFNFDRVFQPKHTQEHVFEEISQLVQSAVDGFKVCIFAYGQTGSGKTHTMLGSSSQRGMIPRSVEQIFHTVQDLEVDGWSFELSASMLEIYNEEYRCLLGQGPPPGQKMKVSHDERGTMVTHLDVVDVSGPQVVNDLISQAMAQRACSATNMNEQSSRSHMVFMLNINGYHDERGEEVHGALNLIDLAGSERLSRSGATGDRLKETQAINKSLSSLGDVIVALANRDQHVPYRNSKLTYLLQGSLGGSAKTLMFVNISPTLESSQESLCSLRFASKVNACELGQAKKSMKRSGSAKSSVDLTAVAY